MLALENICSAFPGYDRISWDILGIPWICSTFKKMLDFSEICSDNDKSTGSVLLLPKEVKEPPPYFKIKNRLRSPNSIDIGNVKLSLCCGELCLAGFYLWRIFVTGLRILPDV